MLHLVASQISCHESWLCFATIMKLVKYKLQNCSTLNAFHVEAEKTKTNITALHVIVAFSL